MSSSFARAIALALLSLVFAAVTSQADQAAPPQTQAIAINPAIPWRASHWSGNLNTEAAAEQIDVAQQQSRFIVSEANKTKVWTYYLADPVDWRQYPILVLRYRARNVGKPGRYLLWLDDGTGPNSGGRVAWPQTDVIDDGEVHELRRDLRDAQLRGQGTITGLAISTSASDTPPGQLELLGLRFEAAPDAAQAPATQPNDASAPQQQQQQETLHLRILDAQQQPIGDATVLVDFERLTNLHRYQTDADGQAKAAITRQGAGTYLVHVSAPGMVAKSFQITPSKLAAGALSLTLSPGQTLGGTVRNEQGEPIAGAAVQFWLDRPRLELPRDAVRELGGGSPTSVTDAQGQFGVENVPADSTQVRLRLMHPDYVSDRWGGQSAQPTLEDLRNRSAVCVMKRGLIVAGLVVDHQGNPVANASVAQGTDQFPSNAPPVTRTDAQGRFRFTSTQPGELVLTARAPKHGPAAHRQQLQADAQDLRIQLTPPHSVRFRVLDAKGQPVPSAGISADTWQGLRTLMWSTQTDTEGRASWSEAPADEVQYHVYARGYIANRDVTASPREEEYVVTLQPQLQVAGSVTDASSGAPIASFRAIPGGKWASNNQPYWERNAATAGRQGQYSLSFTEPRQSYAVRIEADGYRSAVSREIRPDEGQVRIDLQLQPDAGLQGTVTLSDGTPAKAANIYVATPAQSVVMQNHTFQDQGNVKTQADAQGRYRLPALDTPFTLVVIHDSGYAEIEHDKLDKSGDIVLQPWGRVEGQMIIAGKPASAQTLHVIFDRPHREDAPAIYHELTAQTDTAGRFHFDRVPPGSVTVSRRVNFRNGYSYSHGEHGQVLPGQSLTVQLGGVGRPVIGKVVAPPQAPKDLDFSHARAHMITHTPPNALAQAVNSVMGTPRPRVFSFAPDPHGSFRIDDVPPGEYQISVSVPDPKATDRYGAEPLGQAAKIITVPAMTEKYDPQPLDIGELPLTLWQTVKVGDVAPDFEVPTLDDKTVKLSDHRGKLVLLDFWATWCGPCIGETPHLKAVHDRFGNDPRFTMIGLSLDQTAEAPRKYAQDNNLPWIQGFLGNWQTAVVPKNYGVQGIPAIYLIGPDGKVLAKRLRGEAIGQAVQRAVQQMPAKVE